MPKRTLGRTGVQVSLMGLGGFHIGLADDQAAATRLLRMAVDHGVTFLDNCWDYHEGKSEVWMGNALRDGYRARVFLMTKIDGRSRAAAAGQIDQSLKALQTDHIDLVQIHEVIRLSDPDRCFGTDGAIEALVAARAAGKIRFLGFTGHKSPAIHLKTLETARSHGFAFGRPPLRQGAITATQCLHYAMNLATSVVVTGCDTVGVLKPLSSGDVSKLLAATQPSAGDGHFEQHKTTSTFDGTTQNPHWLEKAERKEG